jgi:hypothetical protein
MKDLATEEKLFLYSRQKGWSLIKRKNIGKGKSFEKKSFFLKKSKEESFGTRGFKLVNNVFF